MTTTDTAPKKSLGCFKWGLLSFSLVVALFFIIGIAGGWDRDEDADEATAGEVTEGEDADETEPREAALMARTQEMHDLIDLAFEGCEWDTPDKWTTTVISLCEEHAIFTVVSDVEAVTMNVMEAMAGEYPGTSYYAIEDGSAVMAYDSGNRNLAQDMLGGWSLESGSF